MTSLSKTDQRNNLVQKISSLPCFLICLMAASLCFATAGRIAIYLLNAVETPTGIIFFRLFQTGSNGARVAICIPIILELVVIGLTPCFFALELIVNIFIPSLFSKDIVLRLPKKATYFDILPHFGWTWRAFLNLPLLFSSFVGVCEASSVKKQCGGIIPHSKTPTPLPNLCDQSSDEDDSQHLFFISQIKRLENLREKEYLSEKEIELWRKNLLGESPDPFRPIIEHSKTPELAPSKHSDMIFYQEELEDSSESSEDLFID